MIIQHACSLGSICHTARLLQRNHLKKVSYPFDWVFTDENVVADCIRNDFAKFLDRGFYQDTSYDFGRPCCGHSLYHQDFFFHKDPRTEEDYQYYQRCVKRFRALCASFESKLFVYMVSPELTKHPTEVYKQLATISKEQAIEDMKQRAQIINNELAQYANNYKLLVIMNFGYNKRQTFEFEQTSDNMDFLTLNTICPSKGVTYNDGTAVDRHGIETNQHSDNYYVSGLLNELYKFH